MEYKFAALTVEEYNRIVPYHVEYKNTHVFDESCGLLFDYTVDYNKSVNIGVLVFKIIDQHKWILACIRHSIQVYRYEYAC